jgi:hypothetical protein
VDHRQARRRQLLACIEDTVTAADWPELQRLLAPVLG